MTLVPILVPVELFKCKAQSTSNKSYNMKADFKYILKHEGPRGLYKGALATAIREVPGSGILFMVKDRIE
jgi:hypothetical protein